MSRQLKEIRDDLIVADALSIKPNYNRPPDDSIIDETKSVIWNKEEIKRLQTEYDDECVELRKLRSNALGALHHELHLAIRDQVGGITINDAAKIYEYAYEQSHAYGYSDVFITLDELIDLIKCIVHNSNG